MVGVSCDTAEQLRAFRAANGLPFRFIADVDEVLKRLYRATQGGLLGPFASPRCTYVIDGGGVVRAAFHYEVRIRQHAQDALRALRRERGDD